MRFFTIRRATDALSVPLYFSLYRSSEASLYLYSSDCDVISNAQVWVSGLRFFLPWIAGRDWCKYVIEFFNASTVLVIKQTNIRSLGIQMFNCTCCFLVMIWTAHYIRWLRLTFHPIRTENTQIFIRKFFQKITMALIFIFNVILGYWSTHAGCWWIF